MDGRDGMGMSAPASYYMHRGIDGGAPPSAIPSLPNPGGNVAVGSGAFQVESSPAVSSHGGNLGGGFGGGGTSQSEPLKRKRGRPRKYGPDGNVALALSSISSANPISGSGGMFSGSASGSGTPGQKRGRGRPPGTGRKQQLASLGEWVSGSAGMGFTPHIITIEVGEDIASKIMSFLQQGPRAVCILSANGAVSTVTLCQSTTSGGTVTYEGRFEILCLSGSYVLADNDGSNSRSGGLSVSLSSPDGGVIGGGVGGLLIAATPVQVVVGSFVHGGSKTKNKNKASHESAIEPELQGDTLNTSSIGLPDQNFPSPVIGGWPDSRQLDMRNAHIDIDLMRG